MALLPSGDPAVASSLTHASTTAAIQKLNFTALRTFISDLLGVDSADKAGARAALGAAASGANTDITRLGNNTSTVYTTAGTATAYTITPNPAITAYAAGQAFWVTFHVASGAAPKLTINGFPTPPDLVKQLGNGTYVSIVAGDIPIDHRSRVILLNTTAALVETLPRPILGTVNQTAGVPTGAIIERISNANGEAVRFADGLQLYTAVLTVTGTLTWTFPAAAVANPIFSASVIASSATGFVVAGIEAITTTNASIRVYDVSSASVVTRTTGTSVFVQAIGRWY